MQTNSCYWLLLHACTPNWQTNGYLYFSRYVFPNWQTNVYFYFSRYLFPFSKAMGISTSTSANVYFHSAKQCVFLIKNHTLVLLWPQSTIPETFHIWVKMVFVLSANGVQAAKCICPSSEYISPALTRSGTQVPLWIRRCQNSTSPRWTLSTTALSSRILLM